MKKVRSHVTVCAVMLSLLFFGGFSAYASEPSGLVPRIELITPGITRIIDITQAQKFPGEFSHFLILILGHGKFTINMSSISNDAEGKVIPGDQLVFAGIGISSAGVIPFFKYGVTHVLLKESIEIGNESFPFGVVWFICWMDSTENEPVPKYKLQFGM